MASLPQMADPSPARLADQAQQLRLLASGQSRGARVIAVVSGKGGVGKTNIAANLSVCLAATRGTVTLLDADLGLANADLVLGVRPRLTLSDVLDDRNTLDEVLVTVAGGARLLPGASGLSSMADLPETQRHRLMQIVEQLESLSDYLVIDCGAGIARNVTALAAGADVILVVLTPEPTSIADAYAAIKVISHFQPNGRIGLVVNMARSKDGAFRAADRVASVAKRFLGLELERFGYILNDLEVSSAVHKRTPFVVASPRSPAALCLMSLAGKITEGDGAVQPQPGFMRRVVKLFY